MSVAALVNLGSQPLLDFVRFMESTFRARRLRLPVSEESRRECSTSDLSVCRTQTALLTPLRRCPFCSWLWTWRHCFANADGYFVLAGSSSLLCRTCVRLGA